MRQLVLGLLDALGALGMVGFAASAVVILVTGLRMLAALGLREGGRYLFNAMNWLVASGSSDPRHARAKPYLRSMNRWFLHAMLCFVLIGAAMATKGAIAPS